MKKLRIRAPDHVLPSAEEEVPMSPTLSKVVQMEAKRDKAIDKLESGKAANERETLQRIAKLQAEIETLMRQRLERLRQEGYETQEELEEEEHVQQLTQQQEDFEEHAQEADSDEEAAEEDHAEAADPLEDPTWDGEEVEHAGKLGALAAGQVWVFGAWDPEDGTFIAAYAPMDWMERGKGSERSVTLVGGEVSVHTSPKTGKMFPAQIQDLSLLEYLTPRKAIKQYDESLDNGDYEEFYDTKGRNYIIKLLEKWEASA